MLTANSTARWVLRWTGFGELMENCENENQKFHIPSVLPAKISWYNSRQWYKSFTLKQSKMFQHKATYDTSVHISGTLYSVGTHA